MSWGNNNLGRSTWDTNNLNLTQSPASSGGGLSGQDWASLVASGARGTSDVLSSLSQGVASKKEAQEAARRTMSRLLNSARGRGVKAFRANQNYRDEMSEAQAEQMREIARSFIQSLSGSTGRSQ